MAIDLQLQGGAIAALGGRDRSHLVVPDFFDDAVGVRAAFDKHFADAYSGTPRTHQIWNYFYVPNLYAYFHSAAYKLIPETLLEQFTLRLRQWAMLTLGMDAVSPPYISFYINGCEQQLHNDVGNGRWAYVYSISEDPAPFEGGATILLPGTDYWAERSSIVSAAGVGLYERIAPKFNQLVVFDDRVLHGVETVHGGMNPRKGRVVLQGHIQEGGVYVDGALAPQAALETLSELQQSVARTVSHSSPCRGVVTIRIEVASTGEVAEQRLLVNQIYDPEVTGIVSEIMLHTSKLRFPKAPGGTAITFPIRIQPSSQEPSARRVHPKELGDRTDETMSERISISFAGTSAAESSTTAAELADRLREKVAAAEVEVVKEDRTSLDLGSTVAMVLGSQAIVQAVRTVADYLKYRSGWSDASEVRIRAGTLDLHFKGQPAQRLDVDGIARAVIDQIGATQSNAGAK